MKQDIKDIWVAALRSGEYQQTTRYLCRLNVDGTPQGFCCLGVLTDLYAKAHPGEVELDISFTLDVDVPARVYAINHSRYTTVLPGAVQKWSGVRSTTGEFPSPTKVGENDELAALNDGGATFAELADVIEANWESL